MLQAQESQARIAANNECLRQNQKPDVISPSAERLRERSARTRTHRKLRTLSLDVHRYIILHAPYIYIYVCIFIHTYINIDIFPCSVIFVS